MEAVDITEVTSAPRTVTGHQSGVAEIMLRMATPHLLTFAVLSATAYPSYSIMAGKTCEELRSNVELCPESKQVQVHDA